MEEIRDILRKFNEERSWGRFHTPENLAKPISIEAGEFLECFRCNNEYDREALCDETADVMLYCIISAEATDADLTRREQEIPHFYKDATEKVVVKSYI